MIFMLICALWDDHGGFASGIERVRVVKNPYDFFLPGK